MNLFTPALVLRIWASMIILSPSAQGQSLNQCTCPGGAQQIDTALLSSLMSPTLVTRMDELQHWTDDIQQSVESLQIAMRAGNMQTLDYVHALLNQEVSQAAYELTQEQNNIHARIDCVSGSLGHDFESLFNQLHLIRRQLADTMQDASTAVAEQTIQKPFIVAATERTLRNDEMLILQGAGFGAALSLIIVLFGMFVFGGQRRLNKRLKKLERDVSKIPGAPTGVLPLPEKGDKNDS
jgi:hypothetical protein